MEPAEAATISGLVCAILTAVVAAIINLRKSADESEAKGVAQVIAGYQLALSEVKERVNVIEAALKESYHDHAECLKSQAVQAAKIESQSAKIASLEREVAELKKGA